MGYKYYLPYEDINDENATIVELYFESGNKVKKNDLLYTFETTKTVVDVESEHDGYVLFSKTIGDKVLFGGQICEIFKTIKEYEEGLNQPRKEKSKYKLTTKAKVLAERYSLDIESMNFKGIVRENEIYKKIKDNEYVKKRSKIPSIKAKPNQNLIIIGGGKHTKTCIEIARMSLPFEIIGVVYTYRNPGNEIMNVPVIGGIDLLDEIYENMATNAVLGIGGLIDIEERKNLYEQLKNIGFNTPNLIHPKSFIEESVQLGDGNQIFALSYIGTDVQIGNNCIINSGAIISHFSVLGNNCHVAPGGILGGSVQIGECSLIGMGSTIYYGLRIGNRVKVINNTAVFKNIPDDQTIR